MAIIQLTFSDFVVLIKYCLYQSKARWLAFINVGLIFHGAVESNLRKTTLQIIKVRSTITYQTVTETKPS